MCLFSPDKYKIVMMIITAFYNYYKGRKISGDFSCCNRYQGLVARSKVDEEGRNNNIFLPIE